MQNEKQQLKTKKTKIFRFSLFVFRSCRRQAGFTLIETLVAITILSAAIAGPMALSIKSISLASVSQDQLVAFYLGQEVIEYVRNVRDTNILSEPSDWLEGLEFCKTNGCYIDVLNETVPVTDCGTGGCVNKLKFDGQNYNYEIAGEETAFIRTVKIDDNARVDGDEAKVNVSVKWTGKYGEKIVNLQDNIFNWR